MPVPQVAVEIVINDAGFAVRSSHKNPLEPSGGRAALLSGCTSAAAFAECVDDANAASDTEVVALVVFQRDGGVHIEVGSRRSPGVRGAVRDIRFRPGDVEIERFRAAGYAAGTLAAEVLRHPTTAVGGAPDERSGDGEGNETARQEASSGGAEAEAKAEGGQTNAGDPESKNKVKPDSETPTTPPVPSSNAADTESAPETAVPRESIAPFVWAFDAGLLVGSPSAPDGARFGGYARATRAFGRPMISAAASYAAESVPARGLSLSFVRAFLDFGYAVTLGRIGVEPRVGAGVERLSASVRDPTSFAHDDKSRVVGAVLGGLDLSWVMAFPVTVVIGGSVEARTSATDVGVHGDHVATVAVLDYDASAGLRAQFR